MAKPEKRWQLLLVADDGRIIPFKRIKGLVVTLAILLVALGLICAGLGWQLTAEKVRHGRTQAQLTDANLQLDRYKSENELITAELVLAEVRMEKAGLPVTKRHERVPQQPAAKTLYSKTIDSNAALDVDGKKTMPAAEQGATVTTPSTSSPAIPGVKENQEAASAGPLPDATAKTEPPPVALGELKMTHDTEKKILLARFQVKNSQPRQSSVAGRCVVVLKNDRLAPDSWLAMPKVTLVDGIPDGKHGRAFKISKFINMEMIATVQGDPSSYTTASVYVFDTSGVKVLEKNFPVDLPAPKPVSVAVPAAQPAAEAAASPTPEGPLVEIEDLKMVHDAAKQLLLTRFRLKNTSPPSSPVAGRCVVVLKSEWMDPKDWLAMPRVALENGRPNGARGQAFKISRFRDMEIKARGLKDPSAFKTATVYVFDTAGAKLLEQDVPIDLPAPQPQAEPVAAPAAQPAASPAAPDTQAEPPDSPPDTPPANQPLPAQGVQDVVGSPPSAQPQDASSATMDPPPPTDAPVEAPIEAPGDAPADDPSLTDGVEPRATEDARSRF